MKDLRSMRKQKRFPYRVLLPSALAATLLADPVAQAAPMTSSARELFRFQADRMAWLIDENVPYDPGLTVLENSQGDVTLVEFFDYRCPYCRTMAPASAALIASDSKSFVLMKEQPIFNRHLIAAAKVAIVAATDGKYAACHDAMFAAKSLFDVSKILSVAQLVGLDPARLTQEMDAPEITTELQINIVLAKALDSRGTPTFLVDGYIAASAVADAGAGIATHGTPGGVPACATCHGEHGEGNADAGFPRLSGLSPRYMREQLTAFANGQRDNPIMTPVAKALSKDEAQAVSTYFSNLPSPVRPMPPPVAAVPGAKLATEGRWAEGIPSCFSCHGPGGIGVGAAFPPLAGQPASYIKSQLQAWQAGKRPPGPLGLMGAIARRLTSADISALTNWFATLPGGGNK